MGIYYGNHVYGVRLRGPPGDDDRYTNIREFMGPGSVDAAKAAWQPGDEIFMYVDTSDTYSVSGTSYKSWAREPDDIFGEDAYGLLKGATWD